MSDERLANIETKLDQLISGPVRDLLSGQGRLETDVRSLKTDVGSLKTDVGSLKTDVGSLKTDVRSLKTDVQSLKMGQGRLETGFQSLETGQARLEADVVAVRADLRIEMRVLHEATKAEIQLVAEDVVALRGEMQRGFKDLRTTIAESIAPLTAAVTHHSVVLDDHERRLRTVEEQ